MGFFSSKCISNRERCDEITQLNENLMLGFPRTIHIHHNHRLIKISSRSASLKTSPHYINQQPFHLYYLTLPCYVLTSTL